MSHPGVLILMDRDLKDYTALPLTFIRALDQIGYPTESVFYTVNVRLYKAIYDFLPWLNDTYLSSAQEEIIKQVKKSKCEVVLVVKGVFILPQTIEKIKAMNKRVFCFNPDDPFNQAFGSSNRNIRACIPHYDGYFIWSKELMKTIRDKGCTTVHYMPFAVDDGIIKPEKPDVKAGKEQNIAVSFIGGADKKRIELIGSLVSRLGSGIQIVIYGNDWPQIPGVVVHPAIYGEPYLEVMYRSKINLNILRVQNENSNNMRTFEIPAAGSFMLHESSDEALGFFKQGVEAEFYADANECVEKIMHYLEVEQERSKIAKAGYDRIFESGYLYPNLMKEMLIKMGLNGVNTD